MLRILPLLLLAVSHSAFGQDVTYLVRDLPGLTIHDSMGYGRTFWTNTGNTTWFTAMTAAGTFEVFKTDGTSDGTVQVTHGSGVPDTQHQGPYLGLVNGKLVYGGVDTGGAGVFALDTNGGDPVLLGRFQLNALANTSGVVRGSTLFFAGRPPNNSEVEMWSTDGTPAGTAKIDMFPGAAQGAFNLARETHLFSAGQWMFFFGTTAQGGGVHRTDGTVANTQLVLPLSQDQLTNATETVFPLGNFLLVSLRTGELWSIDSTTGGYVQIATVQRFTPLGVLGGKLLFDGVGIWTTDGTAAGTHLTDVLPVPGGPIFTGQVVGNRLFFISATGIGTLYVTDGTGAGTHAVMLVNQGHIFGDSGFGIGNSYFFRHDDGVHGLELWSTDGTTSALFADTNPGYRTGVDVLTSFARPDGKVLFAAANYDSGREPWITDGTTAGTHLLKNVAADSPLSGSSPHLLRASGSELFFTANLAGGQAIGTSDGTGAGTSANLVDFSSTIQTAVAANGHYFFTTLSPDYTSRLYASDGTSAGTTQLSDQGAVWATLPNGIAVLEGQNELWFSDGTIAGTHKVHSFGPFQRVSIFQGGAVAWVAADAELWKSDGSDAGTIQLVPNPAPAQYISDLTVSGSTIYFIESSSSDHGYRLWRSDGTAAGTTMVKDLGTNSPTYIGATDQMVYFSTAGKLYRSDGTAGGTIALPVDGPCAAAASLGGAFLFMSSTMIPPFTGPLTVTLWRSDGSVAGTTALQVMQPPKTDPGGCGPVVVRGKTAYFSGWDAAHGWELWQSDGTAAGTHLTMDIYPGTKSSSPQELTLAGNLLFFSAESPNIGRELWAVEPQPARHRAVRP